METERGCEHGFYVARVASCALIRSVVTKDNETGSEVRSLLL